MASTYNSPSDYIGWFIRGDSLAIATKRYNSSTNTNNEWVAIDETVTDGILINFTSEPDTVTAVTDTPDIDNTLHLSLVDYVKYRLYLDKAGKEQDPNKSMIFERLAQIHERKWNDGIKRFGMKTRDKVGNPRIIIGRDFT